ncbi:hypothetical protein RFI_20569, partial [Reticulomyxa filosa]
KKKKKKKKKKRNCLLFLYAYMLYIDTCTYMLCCYGHPIEVDCGQTVKLSDDMTRLIWYSRKKNVGETSIAIADIKEILEGQQTEVFKQCTQNSLEKASFSIVYGSKMKTLDLVAKSYEEAKLWTKGLRGLMKAHQFTTFF